MARNDTWINQDGLSVGFGTHTIDNTKVRSIANDGERREIVVRWNAAEITKRAADISTAADIEQYTDKAVAIPKGAIVTSATVNVIEALVDSSGTPTLAIGGYAKDGTADDADGFSGNLPSATNYAIVNRRTNMTGAYCFKDNTTNGTVVPIGTVVDEDVYVVPVKGVTDGWDSGILEFRATILLPNAI